MLYRSKVAKLDLTGKLDLIGFKNLSGLKPAAALQRGNAASDVPASPHNFYHWLGNWLVITSLGIFVSPLRAAVTVNLTKVGQWGSGPYEAVTVSGNYAYAAAGLTGIDVINISNPAAPVRVGRYDTTGIAHGVTVAGNYAYVADGASGLQILNISNPAVPVYVGRYNTPGDAQKVAVAGNYAYVADNSGDFLVIDVSNPAVPMQVDSANVGFRIYSVMVAGNYAYVGGDGFRIIDISNPAFPILLGSLGGYYNAVVAGNYAYSLNGGGGIQAIDISNPEAPTAVEGGWGQYIAWVRPVAVVGNYLYAVNDGLYVIDISDPTVLVEPGNSYATPGNAVDVAVVGNYAYVADSASGLQIFRVTNPTAAVRVGAYDESGSTWGVAVANGYAYLADYDEGLKIINVSNPAAPVQVGRYDTLGNALKVTVANGYAYVADQGAGLQNIAVGTSPGLVSNVPGAAYEVAVSGNYAYVLSDGWELKNIDIEDPSDPLLAGTYSGAGLGTTIVGNYAYMGRSDSGFQILDISNPAALTQVGSCDVPNRTDDVAVLGNYAYLANRENGLQVINVSTPATPVLVGSYDTPGIANSVAVIGNYAYVADDTAGLRVIDISNPATPASAANYSNAGIAQDIATDGNYIYVASKEGRLIIFRSANGVIAPTVTTNAPSVITGTSARLSGTVNPNGAATTVSFNFGTTPTYGQNIAASPTTVAATANVTAVSADKSDLNCNRVYHYQVKATNSAGISLGVNKTFTTPTCPRDLVITNLVLSPAKPVAGTPFNAVITVKNPDTAVVTASKLKLWANQTAVPTCTTAADKIIDVGAIAAGASVNVTVTGLISNVVGINTLRAFADGTCIVVESNETNNHRTLNYRIGARVADLIITNIALTPATPANNTVFNAAITVQNQGLVAASASYLEVWTNQATTQTCGALGDTWYDVGALAAGASKVINVTGLSAGAAGTKTLRAFVDSWCEETESNEVNNQMTKAYTVQ